MVVPPLAEWVAKMDSQRSVAVRVLDDPRSVGGNDLLNAPRPQPPQDRGGQHAEDHAASGGHVSGTITV
jgi:hypothetical protein